MPDGGSSRFECVLCGECCRGDQKVWLNPADLERLTVHLGLPAEEAPDALDLLGKKRIVVVEEGQHGVPRPRLRFLLTPVGPSCRFLVNDMGEDGRLRGRCSLHYTDAKPLVCRLAPLARTVDLADGSEEWREVPPVIGCPGWGGDPPPDEGRTIAAPNLSSGLRGEMDEETVYFRELAEKRRRLFRPDQERTPVGFE